MSEKSWTTVKLSKKQICFLDGVSKNCRFTGGSKLRRTSILRALLKAARRLDIDVTRVRSERELRERLLKCFRQTC